MKILVVEDEPKTGNYLKQGTAPKTLNSAAVGRGVVTVSYAISF